MKKKNQTKTKPSSVTLNSLFQKGHIPITVILHKMKQESLSLSLPGKKNVRIM